MPLYFANLVVALFKFRISKLLNFDMYDIDIPIFKIMLQAIREMFEIEYGYINIYYDKNNNKYILIK